MEHDEHQDQPQHTEFQRDETPAELPAPEHAGFEGTDTAEPSTSDPELSIVEEWGGDYPPGTALFCAKFDADDFDADWGEDEFPDGATVAIRRGSGVPPQGWIIRHAHLSDLERTKAILEKHASPDALRILYSLKDAAFDAFVEAWGKDGGMAPGKIEQVCAAIRQHEAAVRRDVIALGSGLRLDDGRLSWVDLHAVIFAAPPNTAVFHAFEQGWNTTDYLLALIGDGIHDLIWQKTKDGSKNRKRPKRIPRPKRDGQDGTASTGLGKVTVMTVEEFERRRAERQRRYIERKKREARAS
ncbi:tail assembly chaperone [Mycobacterium phage Jolene]|uniref:Tail assembly chaperone n=2 Tax=Mycobacterium virus Halo TaxID=373407 RepID=C5IY94_9CAUD|nr:tail assembly chaperone [Mycobacterium phage Angel]ACB58174.1 tail assembly chaperone [Mycobacterium phage BPs]ACU41478.1 tail chaperone scaffold protein [Mycobacterium phage Hope]AER48470.1 tail assembly chaperone [Mycobacterium phage Avrafan]AJK27282.1 tail assembly chaperone [Mycobacterium phage Gomashi]AKY02619.1 tail assembly chaperone [Mycobacterium phage Phreak]ALF00707.1 tail assembly chaperone [Mycobacterium phage Cedasite]ALF00796.1 tail assembly chaperone [Mycobacterium phage F